MSASDKNRRDALKALAMGASTIGFLSKSENAIAQVAADPAASSPVTMATAPTAKSLGITLADVASAEKLNGLPLDAKQREQVLNVLGDQLDAIKQLKAFKPENGLPPAELFRPYQKSARVVEDKRNASRGGIWPNTALPDLPKSDIEIAYAPAWMHAVWMTKGVLTSRRLTDIYLARIAKLNPKLLAFITVTADLARKQADQADAERKAGNIRSPLHGLPYGVKDLFDTAGIPTTWGAETTRNRIPAADATVVTRLREAGCVLLGKTACGALANGDIWFGGFTRNPWNTEEGSSGSSAGTGSGVGGGLMSFGIGTETMGSIVSPSSRNGCAGLRPSFGVVPRTGAMALCWSLDKTGVLARSVADIGAVVSTIAGDDGQDLASIKSEPFHFYNDLYFLKNVTLGYDPKWFEGDSVSPVERASLEAAKRAGFKLVKLSLPDLPIDPMNAIVTVEAAAAFEEMTLSGTVNELSAQDDQAWPNIFRAARFFPAVSYVQAQRLRRQWTLAFAEVMEKCDALIHPNYAAGLLTIGNVTGYPTLAIKAGFLSQQTRAQDVDYVPPAKQAKGLPLHKVPVSISLTGKLYGEEKLLNIGVALETALGVAGDHPLT